MRRTHVQKKKESGRNSESKMLLSWLTEKTLRGINSREHNGYQDNYYTEVSGYRESQNYLGYRIQGNSEHISEISGYKGVKGSRYRIQDTRSNLAAAGYGAGVCIHRAWLQERSSRWVELQVEVCVIDRRMTDCDSCPVSTSIGPWWRSFIVFSLNLFLTFSLVSCCWFTDARSSSALVSWSERHSCVLSPCIPDSCSR